MPQFKWIRRSPRFTRSSSSRRAAAAHKRGGDLRAITLNTSQIGLARTAAEVIDLDRVLDDLGWFSARQRSLVEMKFFAGLEVDAIAEALGCAPRTVDREWRRARAYLLARLEPGA